jgi:hypothetical protein
MFMMQANLGKLTAFGEEVLVAQVFWSLIGLS